MKTSREWNSQFETAPINPDVAESDLRRALDDVQAVLEEVVEAAGPARPAMAHLIGVRGKMLRPRLVLLSGALVTGLPQFSTRLAAAGELIHTASLLHDDVIDEGSMRRGIPTPRRVWSNSVSILSGDHCLANAVELIRQVDTGLILVEALEAVRNLVDGELVQLEARGKLNLDEEHYRTICRLKTASLFVWCARAGARYAGASSAQIDAIGKFASDLGIAFQMRDDLLDFTGTAQFGKQLLDDLREGRTTLPLILAVREKPALKDELAALFEDGSPERMERVATEILSTEAPAAVAAEITRSMRRALGRLEVFPQTSYRALLERQVEALI